MKVLPIQKLRNQLRKICKNKNIVDIIIFGSVVKAKEKPKDIDLAVIFLEEDYKIIEKITAEIKKINKKIEIEPLFISSLFSEPLYLTIIHEGFSIKENRFIAELLKTKSIMLITYKLENLNHSKKTLFGYALKGRKGEKGFLDEVKGKTSGRNNILIPTKEFENIKGFFKTWNVKIKTQRFLKIKTMI